MDGSGYPDGLRGDEIPLIVRIMTTVDVYDALSTDRCYREAFSRTDALKQMREEVQRGWWDGYLVDELEYVLGRSDSFPVGERDKSANELFAAT